MTLVSGLAALTWASVFFLALCHQQSAPGSTLAARSLIWFIGLAPAIASLLAPRAVSSENTVVDAPPLAGAALQASQALTLAGLTLSGLIIASQLWATTYEPRALGRGPIAALLAVYASVVISALSSGNGGFDRQLFVLPLAIIALYVAPRLSAPELLSQVRLILRIYIYGSLTALIIAPAWSYVAASSLGRDYFHIGGQLAGLTPHPNALSAIAATALVLELAPMARRRTWPVHLAATLVVLLLAQSRTGLIAAAVGLLFLRSTHRSMRPMRWVLGVVVVALTAAFIISPRIATTTLNTLSGNSDLGTLNGRTQVWSYAYDQFLANPVVGFGPNLFDPTGPEAAAGAFPSWAGQAHNQVFQTLGETGVVGMLALVGLVLTLLATSAKRSIALAGISSAMVAIMLTRFGSEAPLAGAGGYDTSFVLLFLLLAVLITPLDELSRHSDVPREHLTAKAV